MVKPSLYMCASIVILISCVACVEDKKHREIYHSCPHCHKQPKKQEERQPLRDLESFRRKRSTSFFLPYGKFEISSTNVTNLTKSSERSFNRTGSVSSSSASRGMRVIEWKPIARTARKKRSFGRNYSKVTTSLRLPKCSNITQDTKIDSEELSLKRTNPIGITTGSSTSIDLSFGLKRDNDSMNVSNAVVPEDDLRKNAMIDDFTSDENVTKKYSSSTMVKNLLNNVENVTTMTKTSIDDLVPSIFISSTVPVNQNIDSILRSLFVGTGSDNRGLRGNFSNKTNEGIVTFIEVPSHNDELARNDHDKSNVLVKSNREEGSTLKTTDISSDLLSRARGKMDRTIFGFEEERATLKNPDSNLEEDLYSKSRIDSRQERIGKSYANISLGTIDRRLSDSFESEVRNDVTLNSSDANVRERTLLDFKGPSILSDVDNAIDRNLTDSLHIRVKRNGPDDSNEVSSSSASSIFELRHLGSARSNEVYSSYLKDLADSFSHIVRSTEARLKSREERKVREESSSVSNPEVVLSLTGNDVNVQTEDRLVANDAVSGSVLQHYQDSEYPKETNVSIISIRRKRDIEYANDDHRLGESSSVSGSMTGKRHARNEIDGKNDRAKWYYFDDEDTALRNQLSDVYPDVVGEPDYSVPMVELIRKKRVNYGKVGPQLSNNLAQLEDYETNVKSNEVENPSGKNGRDSKMSEKSYPEDDGIINSMLSKVEYDNFEEVPRDNEERNSKVSYAEKWKDVRTVAKRDLSRNDHLLESRRASVDNMKISSEDPKQRLKEVFPLEEEAAVSSKIEENLEGDFGLKFRNKRKASLKKLQSGRPLRNNKKLGSKNRKSKNHKKKKKMKHHKGVSKVKRASEDTVTGNQSKVEEERAIDRDLKIDSEDAKNEGKIKEGESLSPSEGKTVDERDVNFADSSLISDKKFEENSDNKVSIDVNGPIVNELKSRSSRVSEVVDDFQVESKIEKRDSSDGRSEVDIAKRDLSRVKFDENNQKKFHRTPYSDDQSIISIQGDQTRDDTDRKLQVSNDDDETDHLRAREGQLSRKQNIRSAVGVGLRNVPSDNVVGMISSNVGKITSPTRLVHEKSADYDSSIENENDLLSRVDGETRKMHSRVKRHQDDTANDAMESAKRHLPGDNVKELKYYDDVHEPETISQHEILVPSSNAGIGSLRQGRAAKSVEEIKGLMEKLVAKVTELQNWVGNDNGSSMRSRKRTDIGNGTDDKNVVETKVTRNDTAKTALCEKVEENNKCSETEKRVEKDRSSQRRSARMLNGRRFRKRKRKKRKSRRKWDRWTDWSGCSVTCGRGRQIRWRHCIHDCTIAETEMEEKACQLPACGPGKFLGIF